jgi:hypothetical protein
MCVDYHGINKITIIKKEITINFEASQTICLAKIFTKVDLGGAYNFICKKKSNEWKPTFNTRYGHFN